MSHDMSWTLLVSDIFYIRLLSYTLTFTNTPEFIMNFVRLFCSFRKQNIFTNFELVYIIVVHQVFSSAIHNDFIYLEYSRQFLSIIPIKTLMMEITLSIVLSNLVEIVHIQLSKRESTCLTNEE